MQLGSVSIEGRRGCQRSPARKWKSGLPRRRAAPRSPDRSDRLLHIAAFIGLIMTQRAVTEPTVFVIAIYRLYRRVSSSGLYYRMHRICLWVALAVATRYVRIKMLTPSSIALFIRVICNHENLIDVILCRTKRILSCKIERKMNIYIYPNLIKLIRFNDDLLKKINK